MDIAAADV